MRRSVIIVLALFSVHLFISCSDESNPTTAKSPCDDPNVSCATVVVLTSEVDFEEAYFTTPNQTATFNSYSVDNSTIENYAPGKHVIITLNFQPPLRVTATYPFDMLFSVYGPPVTCSEHGSAPMPLTVTPGGKWPQTAYGDAAAWRECISGVSSFWTQVGYHNALANGHVLRTLTLEFTVPETYTDGDGAGSAVLPDDANIRLVEWSTSAAGDHTGNPPLMPLTGE